MAVLFVSDLFGIGWPDDVPNVRRWADAMRERPSYRALRPEPMAEPA